jgi:5'-deoxynucleotidase YfbR-like HD superfamily hydrolase
MKTFNEILSFIRAGLAVVRYHGKAVNVRETVGQHSAGVALLLVATWPRDVLGPLRVELLAAALAHDLPECEIGDIPAPTKRRMGREVRSSINTMELEMLADHDLLQTLTLYEDAWLHFADSADGLIYCTEELLRGNKGLRRVAITYLSYMDDLINNHSNAVENIGSSARMRNVFNQLHQNWKEAQR